MSEHNKLDNQQVFIVIFLLLIVTIVCFTVFVIGNKNLDLKDELKYYKENCNITSYNNISGVLNEDRTLR